MNWDQLELFSGGFQMVDLSSSSIDKFPIYTNPDKSVLSVPLNKSKEGLRGLVDHTTNKVHFWDANHATHSDIVRKLGIKGNDIHHVYLNGKNKASFSASHTYNDDDKPLDAKFHSHPYIKSLGLDKNNEFNLA